MRQSKSDSSVIRLRYLDGLRGLAALYVVLFHAYQEADPDLSGSQFSPLLQWATRWLTHGRFSVAIFIVLSGYCLMLPVLHSETGQLRGGIFGYLKRRAQRILPPYYAALILSLLLFAIIPGDLYSRMGMHWAFAHPVFTPGVLLSHLTIAHNLAPDWIYRINGPMWSVATEWQIYFLFALLLLPVWRSVGLAAALPIALLVGFLPHILWPSQLDEASFWYLGLFGLGMTAATVNFSPQPISLWWRKYAPWGKAGVALLAIAIAVRFWNHFPRTEGRIIEDFLAGSAITCLLIAWTHQLTSGKKRLSFAFDLLQSQWAVKLGTFSYSLYLVHLPVLGVAQLGISFLNLSPTRTLVALLAIATPLSILSAYGFHLVFERKDGWRKLLVAGRWVQ